MAWENQYIQLVATKPGLIFGERENDLSEEARTAFREKVRHYGRRFVELGSGSGMHLLHLAKKNPETLCTGFEIRFKRAFKTGEKAEKRGLENVAVLRADARQLPTLFEAESVDGFFVNYPDPWDKRRWWKNRLLNEQMVETMWLLLRPGGMLRYKTDHQEYFQSTLKLLSPAKWRLDKVTTDLVTGPHMDTNIPTEFEQLWRAHAKPLAMLEAIKIS
jgi:tRNA (guanine-N7-)-methyltransferase